MHEQNKKKKKKILIFVLKKSIMLSAAAKKKKILQCVARILQKHTQTRTHAHTQIELNNKIVVQRKR